MEEKPSFQLRRDWRCYSESRINAKIVSSLNTSNVNYSALCVQELWNFIENVIIVCINKIAPLISVNLNRKKLHSNIPSHIMNATDKRKHFLYLDRVRSVCRGDCTAIN